MVERRKFQRVRQNNWLGGVCGGIAYAFGFPVVLVRVGTRPFCLGLVLSKYFRSRKRKSADDGGAKNSKNQKRQVFKASRLTPAGGRPTRNRSSRRRSRTSGRRTRPRRR